MYINSLSGAGTVSPQTRLQGQSFDRGGLTTTTGSLIGRTSFTQPVQGTYGSRQTAPLPSYKQAPVTGNTTTYDQIGNGSGYTPPYSSRTGISAKPSFYASQQAQDRGRPGPGMQEREAFTERGKSFKPAPFITSRANSVEDRPGKNYSYGQISRDENEMNPEEDPRLSQERERPIPFSPYKQGSKRPIPFSPYKQGSKDQETNGTACGKMPVKDPAADQGQGPGKTHGKGKPETQPGNNQDFEKEQPPVKAGKGCNCGCCKTCQGNGQASGPKSNTTSLPNGTGSTPAPTYTTDPNTGDLIDTATGGVIDPSTGIIYDPTTAQELGRNSEILAGLTDTTTNGAGTTTNPASNSGNGTASYITDPTSGALIDTATGGTIDPATGFVYDPTTGQQIGQNSEIVASLASTTGTGSTASYVTDPTTGDLIDTATGGVIDPSTGFVYDPTTGQQIGQNSEIIAGLGTNTVTGNAANPGTGTNNSSGTSDMMAQMVSMMNQLMQMMQEFMSSFSGT